MKIMDNKPFLHPNDLKALQNNKKKLSPSVWEKIDAHIESNSKAQQKSFFIHRRYYAAASIFLLLGCLLWLNLDKTEIENKTPEFVETTVEQPSKNLNFETNDLLHDEENIAKVETNNSPQNKPTSTLPKTTENTLNTNKTILSSNIKTPKSSTLSEPTSTENERFVANIDELPFIQSTVNISLKAKEIDINSYRMKSDGYIKIIDNTYVPDGIGETLFSLFRENEKVKKVKKKINKYKNVENVIIQW